MKAQRFQAIPDGAGYISESDDGLDIPQFHSGSGSDDCEGPSPTPFPTIITGILFGLAIEIILIVLTSLRPDEAAHHKVRLFFILLYVL